MALSMRRIVMLAVVSLMMALTVALSGTALAAPGPPPEQDRGNKLCAFAARAISIGSDVSPGELISGNCVPANDA